MRIGIAADHGGFELKVNLTAALKAAGYALSWDLVHTFLSARFKGEEWFKRRLTKVAALEMT
ncbi:MAG: hypothetical protein ABIK92_20825 [Pseudomonadota bacterium]